MSLDDGRRSTGASWQLLAAQKIKNACHRLIRHHLLWPHRDARCRLPDIAIYSEHRNSCSNLSLCSASRHSPTFRIWSSRLRAPSPQAIPRAECNRATPGMLLPAGRALHQILQSDRTRTGVSTRDAVLLNSKGFIRSAIVTRISAVLRTPQCTHHRCKSNLDAWAGDVLCEPFPSAKLRTIASGSGFTRLYKDRKNQPGRCWFPEGGRHA